MTGISWLDLRLGIRMLIKYPVLTVVGGLAMAFAIGSGVGTFEAIKRATEPDLPLSEGERIVGFNYWDAAHSSRRPTTAYDFLMWREGLRTVEDLGGFRLRQRNLVVGQDGGLPTEVAEISAAAFRVARVPPLLGRTLVESDEEPSAAPVVVLGHYLWQMRFAGDPAVVGRAVRLGEETVTVVGVMPEGFAFPISQNLWTALKPGELPREPGRGALQVFGRLAPGATLREAQAESAPLGARAASKYPEHYANLRLLVRPYAESIISIPPNFLVRAGIESINVLAALFLLVVCGNVALLMFARAATREREILVRGALGASRSRIVMQLFVEALVLSAVAAVVGLTATNLGFTWALDAMSPETEGWPFWVAGGLSTTTVTYGFLLTLLAAVVTGVVPALKVTGGNLEARLRAASTGTGSPQMGGIWTVLMVAQVGATVLFSGVAFLTQRQAAHIASTKAAFPSEEYLAVRLEMDRRTSTAAKPEPTEQEFRTNYAAAVRSLERRLAAEPTLAGVTLAERLPLMPQSYDLIEVDDAGPSSERKHRVGTSAVDVDFFEVFQTRVIEGQGFGSADWVDGGTIVVNTLFVDEVLGGRNAIGRRIRYAADPGRAVTEAGPWLEIVGIVPDLVLANTVLKLDNPAKPLVYRPLGPTTYPVHLAAHVRGHAGSFEPTLRRIAGEQSPMLRLDGLQRLDQATSSDARAWRVLADVITATSAITLFLSLAAIYAVMSYTVTRRTREIAVRVALGARAEGVVALILRKPLATVAAGAVLGCIPVGGLVAVSMRGSLADIGTATGHATLLVAHAIVMIGVCALACIGPTVRALRVEPTEALRED